MSVSDVPACPTGGSVDDLVAAMRADIQQVSTAIVGALQLSHGFCVKATMII